MAFDLNTKLTEKRLNEFADILRQLSREIGFKVSSRGWCYIMEQRRLINKDQFDRVQDAVNRCRSKGILPIDFVAEDSGRMFGGVERPTEEYWGFEDVLEYALNATFKGAERYWTPNWWEGEDYYVQMVVEKVDLINLFSPVTRKYHIPIANAKGWSSMSQRAEYARRFKAAEDNGLQCVLLYCGDHDPDGLRISETLRSNLEDVKDVVWADGETGYDPENLIIDRFGLNYDFIIENRFTWIDNLITGSGKNLADPRHVNFKMPYVQDYLKKVGERKAEANVLVVLPQIARAMCEKAINKYVTPEALERFEEKIEEAEQEYQDLIDEHGVRDDIQAIIDKVKGNNDEDAE